MGYSNIFPDVVRISTSQNRRGICQVPIAPRPSERPRDSRASEGRPSAVPGGAPRPLSMVLCSVPWRMDMAGETRGDTRIPCMKMMVNFDGG